MRHRRQFNSERSRMVLAWWLALTLLLCIHIQLCAPFALVKCSPKPIAIQLGGSFSSAGGATGERKRRGEYATALRERIVPWPLSASTKEGDADVAYRGETKELRKAKRLERKIKQVCCPVEHVPCFQLTNEYVLQLTAVVHR